MLINVHVVEEEDIVKLRAIADRLGDTSILSFDERRDLMNKLCLILSNIQEVEVGI